MKIKWTLPFFLLFFFSYQMYGMYSGPKFTDLPLEIIQEIFKCTDVTRTFCALRKTCKANRKYLEKFSHETFIKWYTSLINKEEEKKIPLVFAVKKGHFYVIQRVLKTKGIDVNKAGSDGMTLLHWAVVKDNSEILRILLEHNPDINKGDSEGGTPLKWAAYYGHIKIVRILLEHNADVNKASFSVETPLNWAACLGHVEIVSILLEHKADVNKANRLGKTPLYWARYCGHTEIIKLLKEHGAKK